MDPIPTPALETERLLLRRILPQDAPGVFDLFSQEEVVRFIDIELMNKPEQAEVLIHQFDEVAASGRGVRWGVFSLEDGALIGTCGYHDWDRRRFRAEISYDLSPGCWGRGFMREALTAVLDYGFHQMNLRRIEALIDPADLRSQNLLTGLGFQLEGTLREHDFIKGRFQDDMIFALLHDDWGEASK